MHKAQTHSRLHGRDTISICATGKFPCNSRCPWNRVQSYFLVFSLYFGHSPDV